LEHLDGPIAGQPDDLERVVRQGQRHRLDVQVVTQKDGDVVAPSGVHGQAAAPEIGIVDDVVVYERGSVNDLDDGSVQDRAIPRVPAEAAGHEQNGGTHALPAAR